MPNHPPTGPDPDDTDFDLDEPETTGDDIADAWRDIWEEELGGES